MIKLNLTQLDKFGVDPVARKVGFIVKGEPDDVELQIGFDELATLTSAMFKASEYAVRHIEVAVNLEHLPADKFVVIEPTQLDVARQPKSDGHLSFQVGTMALKVNLNSLAMDFLTQLLNQRR